MQSQQVVYASAPQQGQWQQAQMVQPQPGQTIVIQTGNLQQARPATYDNYSWRGSISLGLVLIIAGCLLIVFNAVGIGVAADLSFVGHGIWGGVWPIKLNSPAKTMQSQKVVYAPAPQQGQGQQAQMVQPQPGQTIVIQTGNLQQARPATYDNYSWRGSISLGLVLIIAGCLLIVLNAVGIGVAADLSFVGHGIWGGVWHILTGVFGVWAGKTKQLCQILAFMILAILAAVLALVGMVMFAVAASVDNHLLQGSYWSIKEWSDKEMKIRIAVNAIAASVSGIAGVISVICAALCCSGVCCGRPAAPSGFTIAQAGSSSQPAQVVYIPAAAAQTGVVGSGGPMQPVSCPVRPTPIASAPMADAPPDYVTTMQEKRPL